jgi:hypothetical protein
MAVAVATGVYDLTVVDAMDGGTIRDITSSYKPYFDGIRTTPERSSWFVELEWLGEQIRSGRCGARQPGSAAAQQRGREGCQTAGR